VNGKSPDRDVARDRNAMSLWYENNDIDCLRGYWISDVRPISPSRRQSRHSSLAYDFFRIQASCAPNSSAPDPSRAEYFRRDSACNPRRQSTTDAQSARAGKIRDGRRKCLARSRRPREMERNQSLHHFFLAHCCLTNGVGPAADRPIQASRESLQGFLRYAGTGIGPMSPPQKRQKKISPVQAAATRFGRKKYGMRRSS